MLHTSKSCQTWLPLLRPINESHIFNQRRLWNQMRRLNLATIYLYLYILTIKLARSYRRSVWPVGANFVSAVIKYAYRCLQQGTFTIHAPFVISTCFFFGCFNKGSVFAKIKTSQTFVVRCSCPFVTYERGPCVIRGETTLFWSEVVKVFAGIVYSPLRCASISRHHNLPELID